MDALSVGTAEVGKAIFHTVSKLEVYAIAGLIFILAVAGAYFRGHHSGYEEGFEKEKVEFDKFVNETKAAGLKAEQDRIDKEKSYATQIATATSDRDAALQRMRVAEAAASAARRAMPLTPAAANGSNLICFEQKALSAAVEQYRGRVRGLAQSGDETAVDARALIQAWPSQSKPESPK